MIRFRFPRRLPLGGWTRTGGRAARGQEMPRMPDGSPNWSVPRCAPDNSPLAVARRVAEIVVPLAGGLPVALFGLWGVNQPAAQRFTGAVLDALPGGPVPATTLLITALGWWAVAGWIVARWWTRRRQQARVQVQVQVRPAQPVGAWGMDPTIPAGQLMFHRFDAGAVADIPRPAPEPARVRSAS